MEKGLQLNQLLLAPVWSTHYTRNGVRERETQRPKMKLKQRKWGDSGAQKVGVQDTALGLEKEMRPGYDT
jgi:hypothetical protein